MKKNMRAIPMMTSMLTSPPTGARDYNDLYAGFGVQPFNRLLNWGA
jgi:hypothetical protein